MSADLTLPDAPLARAQPSPEDQLLVSLWLHNRSPHTQRAYGAAAAQLVAYLHKPLTAVTLADLQAFSDSLSHMATASQHQRLAAIKSLLTYGHDAGILPLNVGVALRLPKVKDTLAERILEQDDVKALIAGETNPRNHALIRLLYAAGLRIAEACGLHWRDLQRRGQAGQVTVFGKGGKTRIIKLSPSVWDELQALRGDAKADQPVFRSRQGHALDESQARRIVKKAAQRAGLDDAVSPHWMRHSHATHALRNGANLNLVQATLGHANIATTGRYLHVNPNESSGDFLDS